MRTGNAPLFPGQGIARGFLVAAFIAAPLISWHMEVTWSKTAIIQFLALASFASLALGGWLERPSRIFNLLPTGILPVIFLAALAAIAVTRSASPAMGLRSLIIHAANPGIFILSAILMAGGSRTGKFYNLCFIPAAVVSIYGISQYHLLFGAELPANRYGDPNPCSTFGLVNYGAEYLVGIIPGLILSVAAEKRPMRLSLKAGALAAILYYFLVIKVRAGYIGLLAGVALLIYFKARGRELAGRAGTFAPAALAAAAIIIVATPFGRAAASRFMTSFEFSSSQIRFRLLTWLAGAKMAADHPLLGVGPGNFQVIEPLYESAELTAILEGTNVVTDKAHNDPLEALCETGAVGIGLFAWLGISIAMSARRREGGAAGLSGPLSGLGGIFAASMFSFPLQNPASSMIFWGSAGMASRPAGGDLPGGEEVGVGGRGRIVRLIPVLVIPAGLVIAVVSARLFLAESGKMEGAYLMNSARFRSALEKLERARDLDPWFDPIIFFDLSITRSKLGDPDGAVDEINRVIKINPYSGKAYLMLSNYLSMKGDRQAEASALDRGIRAGALKGESAWYNLIDAHVKNNDLEKALSSASDACAAYPGSGFLKYKLANVKFYMGDYRAAASGYSGALALDPENETIRHNLVVSLIYLGEAAGAIELLREGTAKSPASPALHYDLAIALAIMGEAEGSASALKKAIGLKPSLRERSQKDKYFDRVRGDPAFLKAME